MKIEALAAKLNCDLVVHFQPKHDRDHKLDRVDNPTPWSVQKQGGSNEHVRAETLDEACDKLLALMIKNAEKDLIRAADSAGYASAHLAELKKLAGAS